MNPGNEDAPPFQPGYAAINLGVASSDTLGKTGPIIEMVRDWNGDGISDE